MRRLTLAVIIAVLGLMSLGTEDADAGKWLANRWGYRFAQTTPWHGNYYHRQYGAPVALVVPPTANAERRMGWGVSQTELMPIYHQFRRAYPGMVDGGMGGGMGGPFRPTPYQPSHTDQFGIYYVRGPW